MQVIYIDIGIGYVYDNEGLVDSNVVVCCDRIVVLFFISFLCVCCFDIVGSLFSFC